MYELCIPGVVQNQLSIIACVQKLHLYYINFVYQTFGCQATTTKSIKYKGIESALI